MDEEIIETQKETEKELQLRIEEQMIGIANVGIRIFKLINLKFS